MAAKEKIVGDVAVLTVSGNLMTEAEIREVHEKVKSFLREGIKKVVMDLSKIEWLSSIGLGLLISCHTSLQNAGGILKIAGVNDRVHNLLIITKLITVFETFETTEEAVTTFKG